MSVHVDEYNSDGKRVESLVVKDYDEAYRLLQGRVSTPENKRSKMAFQIYLAIIASSEKGSWKRFAEGAYAAVDAFLALEQ